METTARNRTIGGIVIGAIILILLLVLFSCTVNGDPQSSPKENPTTGESSLPSDPDTIEPDEDPSESESESESEAPEEIDGDDIVPAANTGVAFIPAGNVPSGSTPTCELDPSACEPVRPPGAGVDICEVKPDLTQCQPPTPPTTPPGDGEPTTPPDDGDDCIIELGPLCVPGGGDDDDEEPGPGDGDGDNGGGENQPPTAPVANACQVETSTRVTISWSRSDDPDGKVDGYNVYHAPDDGHVVERGKTSATFGGLTPGDTYTFWVTAVDRAGNESEDSNRVDCVMDVTAPQIPQDLTVENGDPSDSTLNVSWSESEDNTDGVGDVTYNLYRNGKLLTAVNGTSFEDTGLTAGTEYTYTVTAVDGAGNESDPSAEESGTTTKIAPTVPQNVKVTNDTLAGFDVSWSASTDQDGVTPQDKIVYIVEVRGGLLGGILCTTRVTGVTSTSITCLLSQDGTVTVTAEDESGNQSAPSDPAPVSGESAGGEGGNTAFRSNTPDADKSDAPGESPVPSDAPDVKAPDEKAPVEEPTEEKSPLLPGLGDLLPGGEDSAEAPAEEPAEPEATPSESESPAARPVPEEPVSEEPTTKESADEATEEAPAEKDENGLLENIGDALTSAVAAVF